MSCEYRFTAVFFLLKKIVYSREIHSQLHVKVHIFKIYYFYIATRWTEKYLSDANIGRPADQKHDMRIFDQFVLIPRHDAAEEAAEKVIDQTLPRRRIRRRHSMMNLAEVVEEEGAVQMQNVADVPAQVHAKKRRFSMDARTYLAPPEMHSAIDTFRQTDGVMKYNSSFHSVKQKQANVVAIGAFSVASTSTNTNRESSSNSNISPIEQSANITIENTDTGDALMDITNNINVAVHEMEPSDISMENIGENEDSTASVSEETLTLAQMEENLRKLRERLGKFDSVFLYYKSVQ